MLLVVLTANPHFVAGDNVLATYTAQDTGQPTDVVVNVSGKVEADQFGSKKPCILEVPNAKVFAGSRVTATYELRRPNGDLVGNSITANATVTGATPIDLLPPFLVAPAVDPVDVLAYPNGITMRIEYLAALDGDRARLAEVNPPAGSPQFPLVAFNSNKRVNTVLTPAYLAARQGKSFELRWNLNRNGGQAGKSTPTPLRVLKIADGDSRLPTPKILQAPDDKVLDLNTFEGNAELTVLPWLGISTDNVVQLEFKGKDNNNDDYVILVLTNHKITEQEKTFGIKETLHRDKLSILQHATSIQVTLELLPSPASTSIIFPILILHFLNAPQVITESFETGKVEWKDEGTIMDFPSMTVTVIKGPVALDGNAAIEYAPFLTGNYFHLNVDETLRFTLKRPSKSVRFGIATRIKSTALTEYYDEDFKLIKAQSTQSYDAPHQAWVDVTETVNRKIKYVDVTIKGFATTRLDNFSLFY
ncbi:hypothetical protein JFT91_19755 [Pseudomonas sp. TH08]|uniref:hypothetical protein n=1 Tax=Pseudomonas sp. TH08 TaxID=2796374 RepID=UPI001912ECC8|nr:hypothetical protein [Pseudomonas sp. TH08]MBK5534796.1 hypothetical protein [Pseudomonas sp. TH08]